MPAVSRKQQRWAYAELGKIKKGDAQDTGMTAAQLQDFTTMKPQKKGKK